MKKLTNCPCGCGEKVVAFLPLKAQRIKARRMNRQNALRKEAYEAQLKAALKKRLQLATMPAGGNA